MTMETVLMGMVCICQPSTGQGVEVASVEAAVVSALDQEEEEEEGRRMIIMTTPMQPEILVNIEDLHRRPRVIDVEVRMSAVQHRRPRHPHDIAVGLGRWTMAISIAKRPPDDALPQALLPQETAVSLTG